MRKAVALFTCATLVAGLFVGCAQKKAEDKTATGSAAPEKNVTLTIWHDLGDNGNKWFNEIGKTYKEKNPNVTIQTVSYPTDQWIEKSIAALNTNSAPDIIFNNYERVIKVQDQTSKISDLSSALNEVTDKSFLSEQDLKIATYKSKKIIVPVQRVQAAFGVRKSWMDKVGAKFPTTWKEALDLAKKFNENDPDGNGKNDTYGFALQAAKPRDLVHMLDLFGFGSGVPNTVIDPTGKIVINDDRHKEITTEFVNIFTKYGYTPKDTINYSFTDMYQVIEGNKAGMFRVGDWNVKKWDDVIKGDYELGPWPAFRSGDPRNVVISGMRGAAVPENAPNKKQATEFVKFLLTKEAQTSSLVNVGAAVRNDINIEMSEHQKFFAQPKNPLIAYDFPESTFSYYPQLEEVYHKALLSAMSDPKVDLNKTLEKAEKDMKDIIAKQKK